MKFLILRIPFVILALFVATCSPVKEQSTDEAVVAEDLVWPSQPDDPKIKYLYTFSSPKDLGMGRGLFRKLLQLLGGKQQSSMLRPYAIAADDELIAVADPGLGALHLFNIKSKKYNMISELAKEAFDTPVGIAMDSERIYLADSEAGKIFVLNRSGKHLQTFTGVKRPTGIAIHEASGRLYVTDTGEHHIVILDMAGNVMGTIGSRGSGTGEFNFPSHLALYKDTLYVNDTLNFRIQSFDLAGHPLFTFGKLGDSSGQFAQSKGVGIDSEGHIYVADALSNYIQIFDQRGRFLLAFGGMGAEPGKFILPAGLSISGNTIYVADSQNRRVQVFEFLGGNI